jgi:hypothetical protein
LLFRRRSIIPCCMTGVADAGFRSLRRSLSSCCCEYLEPTACSFCSFRRRSSATLLRLLWDSLVRHSPVHFGNRFTLNFVVACSCRKSLVLLYGLWPRNDETPTRTRHESTRTRVAVAQSLDGLFLSILPLPTYLCLSCLQLR